MLLEAWGKTHRFCAVYQSQSVSILCSTQPCHRTPGSGNFVSFRETFQLQCLRLPLLPPFLPQPPTLTPDRTALPPKRLWGAGCGTGPPLHLPPGTCIGRLMPVEARGSPVSNLKPRARATRPSPSCQEQPGLRGGGQGAVSPRGPRRRCSDRLHNHRKVCPQPASCWLPRGSPRIPRPGTRGPARCPGHFPRGGPWRHRAHRANPHEPAKSQRNG